MDEARLLEGVLRGVLGGGRRRRGRRTLQYLTGSRAGSFLSNPQVLMTAAGLAWGLIETLQGQVSGAAAAAATPAAAPVQTVPVPPVPPLPVVGAAVAAGPTGTPPAGTS